MVIEWMKAKAKNRGEQTRKMSEESDFGKKQTLLLK